jgi:hypothetical protein
LEAREQAVRVRVEGLRAEMDRLAECLAAEQELLGRLEITRQTVIEILAGDDVPREDVAGIDPAAKGGVVAAATRVSRAGMQVPVFGQDGDGGGRRLPVAYRDVVEVVADAGPLRARQVCQTLGLGAEPKRREGCGSSSSGWWGVAGWSRSPRVCSPALGAWLVG